ncbi:MAG TPA: DUF2752 domain-containing protein [Blastocatellia bacterium]
MKGSVRPAAGEWWDALRWVLLTFTFLMALAIGGSFVSYERVVADGHPWLPRVHCKGCMFCGMTRSFCAMSSGRWQEAENWNRGGPLLYVGGWLWLAGGAVVFIRLAHKGR